jgi:aspartate--ammonia ligase
MRIPYPEGYTPLLNIKETEDAIRQIKEFFQTNLAFELNLIRTTAPLFVQADTGINDNLNGIEKPVAFTVKDLKGKTVEIVQSLAKWKRMALADYGFAPGEGIYTDMNALRPDETLDSLHSIYVDQWDWERVITREDRSLEFLKRIVRTIYQVMVRTERYIGYHFEILRPMLPDQITFFHSEELEEMYPELEPSDRERRACREHGAIFVIGIGGDLRSGRPHDNRAPDYDDWITPTGNGRKGLNGDILVHNELLDIAFELSSMGIRVDAESLTRQLEITGTTNRARLMFHRRLLADDLPLSIGGGIGQSRLCMFYLKKAHVGEIQASLWPEEMREECGRHNIVLL